MNKIREFLRYLDQILSRPSAREIYEEIDKAKAKGVKDGG